ncbi:MAG TPA: amidase family protein [Vicinamibacterales bacterium]|nr:amidase family protein [Vicinamibacterales bacterium]
MRRLASLLLIPVTIAIVTVGTRGQERHTTLRVFDVVETSIPQLQAALESGQLTSHELVLLYMQRIALYEDRVNAVAYLSRTALDEADLLDQERAAGRIRGPLHGIPVAVKDIINTTNMPTTGGAVAFEGIVPPYDAPLVVKLKEAGAIIIAKTVLTELANWVTVGMPGNYSGLFGFAMNPYDPRIDPVANDGRPVMGTGGSSSGGGTTLSFWAASVGTETSGSILSPSNQNMLAGIKPTLGLISRYGVIPITGDQDTAGPMARTVTDAAIMLGAMAGFDPNDPATNRCTPPPGNDYTRFLRLAGLQGARIGIPRAQFYNPTTRPDTGATVGGINAAQLAVMEDAIRVLRAQGATIVDPADIPSVLDRTPANNFSTFPTCSGTGNAKGSDANCSVVFKYGMKRDFNAYLASLGPGAPFKTLTQLRQYNLANQNRNTIRFGQQQLDISDEMDLNADRARYEVDRRRDIFIAATHGIDEAIAVNNLDALLFPGSSSAAIAAKAGHPTVIVPFGFIPNVVTGVPASFNLRDQPYGVGFTGTACTEPRLLELAYAFEQATKRRVRPPAFP